MLLYFPAHSKVSTSLKEWRVDGNLIGFSRKVENPKMVWLVMHGNAGQAATREYLCDTVPDTDSVYVLEYPGYGQRKGVPSISSFKTATEEAFRALQKLYPGVEIGVIGESLGSGPASYLGSLSDPPSRVVLIVPFKDLVSVAQEKFTFLPIWLVMRDRWDNAQALSQFKGRIDIYGALEDTIIPVHHARNLANSLPGAVYHEMPCEHNEWAGLRLVRISH